MYPLTFVRLSRKRKVTVELANNQSITGTVASCDLAMNLHLLDATVTTEDSKTFPVKECYVRGQSIRFVKVDPRLLSKQYLFN
ncbi:U6 snRNA-associated Sm-like protein LSm4 [Pancytospora philotis]|nr:U6 snRNA-associated Sm-like protein LSm4 [Pancytospora philotis]